MKDGRRQTRSFIRRLDSRLWRKEKTEKECLHTRLDSEEAEAKIYQKPVLTHDLFLQGKRGDGKRMDSSR